ncbi:MAG: serine/threonine-protein kinase, partial [Myxococcota bacterium]
MEEPITGAGRYQRSTMVGAGGMGVVHRGFDRVLRREVAIKTLQGDLAKDDDSRQRMLREARAVAGLNHPNIVQLYDIFEDDTGTLSLVFEYVDGQSLSARIAKHGRLPLAAVLPICDDLVGALATAHGAGFVHRDIKPSNILLRRPGGRAVLLDFGIARPADDTAVAGSDALRATSSDITGPGMVLGTPGYMAPEQVDAQHRIGPGTDQFQLAVTLFEAIAGRLPWSDRSGGIVNIEKARSLRELDPALGEVDRVLAHALRPDVDDRYADIRLFADAFREAAAGGLAIAPGPMTPPPARHTAPTRVRGDATGPGDPAGPESEIRATRGPPVTPPRGAADAAEDGMAWSEAGPGERAVVEGKSAAARRKGLAFAAGALLALALLAIVAWSLGSEGDALVPSQPGEVPLVACPLFDVEGLGRDAAWLGAAAGQLACERVQLISGGTDGVAAGPPELLELPVLPDSDTDRRPYDAPGARERSREAALALRADAVLTGTVRVTRDRTFGVRLSLARRSGRV